MREQTGGSHREQSQDADTDALDYIETNPDDCASRIIAALIVDRDARLVAAAEAGVDPRIDPEDSGYVWVCNKCGQLLVEGAGCNSGYHVGPDGGNKGKAIRSDVAVAAAERTAAETKRADWLYQDCAEKKREIDAAEAERDAALAQVEQLETALRDYMDSCPADSDDFVEDIAAQNARAALGDPDAKAKWGPDHPSYDEMGQ